MIKPLLHRVVVKPKEVETKTESGIMLALNERKEQTAAEVGTVVALGDTAFVDYNTQVIPKIGDTIYFAKYAGKWIKDKDGTELVILNDEDCIGVLE